MPSPTLPPRVHPRDPHGQKYQEAAVKGRKAIVHGTEGATMQGFVFEGFFHVHDTCHGGATHRDLTGQRPVYAPIPIGFFAEVGYRLEYSEECE